MSIAEPALVAAFHADELGIRVNPCIEILATTDARLADGPHAGWLNFYNAFLKRFGAQMRWYRTNTDDHFKKVTPAKLDMVPFWFNDARTKEQTLLGIEVKSGAQPKDMQLPCFEFNCDSTGVHRSPVGVFHIGLPLQAGFETVDAMLPLVHEALAEFPLLSGYVGYTVYWDTLDFRFENSFFGENMPRLYLRHPGIGLAEPTYLKLHGLHGLVGVSWLTLLGPAALQKVGGLAALQARLADPISVHPLACQGGGALITAGPKPLVGDLSIGDDLPLYRAVGQAVREARRSRTFYGGGLDNAVAHQWFMRFFGE